MITTALSPALVHTNLQTSGRLLGSAIPQHCRRAGSGAGVSTRGIK